MTYAHFMTACAAMIWICLTGLIFNLTGKHDHLGFKNVWMYVLLVWCYGTLTILLTLTDPLSTCQQ